MGHYEHESVDDREDAEALTRAEDLILAVASEHQPKSLSELRALVREHAQEGVDSAHLRVALWSLLNRSRLELTSDRSLRVAR
jgi:hypothetical protein